jgi:glutamate formiminotransferase/glutamate formiminotransferase/formiminotetrahydrofolate cyclodeaminase
VSLLEAVPNLSEGRDASRVRELAATLSGAPGVRLLDVSSDPDHHRSVFTAIGEAAPLVDGLYALIRAAAAAIDLRHHAGAHPRVGAVDVVPFVPLGGAALRDAVEAAHRLGSSVGDRLGIPVFLYGEATPGSERRVPADLRRLGLAGMAAALEAGELRPDYGPSRLHATAGAILIGARTFLVAFNVWLRSADLRVARAVARAIRERDGGLPGVQALGLFLESRSQAQVSVNLLRPDQTSLHAVVERIASEARARGVEIDRGEIVGLVPESVVLRAAAEALRLPELTPSRILEWHLRREPEV